jgi:hypothetical protein
MKTLVCFGAFLIVSILGGVAMAESDVEIRSLAEGKNSPPAKIEDIAFLTGYWGGAGFGGKVEELILPAAGGQMMSSFRSIGAEGEIGLYEFIVLMEVGDSLAVRLKHFHADLKGWEEKDEYVEFPLVAIEGKAVYFDGLTYIKTGQDTLSIAVSFGEGKSASFHYTRIANDWN